jgi:hypothetical protein
VCVCIVSGVCVDIEVRSCSLGKVSGKEDCMVREGMVGWVREEFQTASSVSPSQRSRPPTVVVDIFTFFQNFRW